jgi:chromosome segregation ATPase
MVAQTNGVRQGLHNVTARMTELSAKLQELTQLQWSLQTEADSLRREVTLAEEEKASVRVQLESITHKMGGTMQLLTQEMGNKQQKLQHLRDENHRLRVALQLP